jgi:hypothetical protein
MLINVFSLHRTGSTWWAHYIKNQYENGILYNEIFNQLKYYKRDEDLKHTPYEEYEEGLCWRCPNDSYTEIVHNYRELTSADDDRFDRWLKFFELSKNTAVVHTHLSPLQDLSYLTKLSEIGDKNYYVYRENVLEQMASYQIMKHNGIYGVFTKDEAYNSEKFGYPIIDIEMMEWFCGDIMNADKLAKERIVNFERIRYESMPFNKTVDGMPLKQSRSAFNRLCLIDQTLIKQIYARAKNDK